MKAVAPSPIHGQRSGREDSYQMLDSARGDDTYEVRAQNGAIAQA